MLSVVNMFINALPVCSEGRFLEEGLIFLSPKANVAFPYIVKVDLGFFFVIKNGNFRLK